MLHAAALHGRPYDGHTLKSVLFRLQGWTGVTPQRVYVDRGYRGRDYPNKHRVFRSGQKRGVHGSEKREPRRRSVVEPVMGHLKSDGHLGHNYLKDMRAIDCGGIQLPVAAEVVQAALFAPKMAWPDTKTDRVTS